MFFQNIPPNNPTWDAVQEQIQKVRKTVHTESRQQFTSLSLIKYLDWAKTKIDDIFLSTPSSTAIGQDSEKLITRKVVLFELVARFKPEIVREFTSLVIPNSNTVAHSRRLQDIKHVHDHVDDEKLVQLFYEVLSIVEPHDALVQMLNQPMRAVTKRKAVAINDDMKAMVEAKNKGLPVPIEVSLKSFAEGVKKVVEYKQHFDGLLAKVFGNDAEIKKIVEDVSQQLYSAPTTASCFIEFVEELARKSNLTTQDVQFFDKVLDVSPNISNTFVAQAANIIVKAVLSLPEQQDHLVQFMNAFLVKDTPNSFNSLYTSLRNVTKSLQESKQRTETYNKLVSESEDKSKYAPLNLSVFRTLDVSSAITVPAMTSIHQNVFQVPAAAAEIKASLDFYTEKVFPCNKEKKLYMKWDHGYAVVQFNNGYTDQSYDLVVSPLQLVILSILNNQDGIYYKDLKKELTHISPDLISVELAALVIAPDNASCGIIEYFNDKTVAAATADTLVDDTMIVVNDYFEAKTTTVQFYKPPVKLDVAKTTQPFFFDNITQAVSVVLMQEIIKTGTYEYNTSKPATFQHLFDKVEKMQASIAGFTKPTPGLLNDASNYYQGRGFFTNMNVKGEQRTIEYKKMEYQDIETSKKEAAERREKKAAEAAEKAKNAPPPSNDDEDLGLSLFD